MTIEDIKEFAPALFNIDSKATEVVKLLQDESPRTIAWVLFRAKQILVYGKRITSHEEYWQARKEMNECFINGTDLCIICGKKIHWWQRNKASVHMACVADEIHCADDLTLNVINKTGNDANAKQDGGAKWDGEKWVLSIVLNAMGTNKGGFKSSMGAALAR